MKRRLTITWIFSVFLLTLSAQSTHNSRVMKEFADSLRELSASYFAYHRLWEDMDAPAPRGVKLKPDYYKLFVPPTYYFSPVEQAFAFEWEPGDHLGMNACDSIYMVKKDVGAVYELPNMTKTASVDRWVNKILLNFYLLILPKRPANKLKPYHKELQSSVFYSLL